LALKLTPSTRKTLENKGIRPVNGYQPVRTGDDRLKLPDLERFAKLAEFRFVEVFPRL
jgi:hypothetical protein